MIQDHRYYATSPLCKIPLSVGDKAKTPGSNQPTEQNQREPPTAKTPKSTKRTPEGGTTNTKEHNQREPPSKQNPLCTEHQALGCHPWDRGHSVMATHKHHQG